MKATKEFRDTPYYPAIGWIIVIIVLYMQVNIPV